VLSFLLSLVLIFSFISTSITATAAVGDTFEFQILFTSDLHGCFSDWSYSTNTSFTGLARVATKINELRADKEDTTILIDMGDTIQGNGTSVFHTDIWDNAPGNTMGMYPVLIGLEYLNYDVWVLGNHEFNFGIDRLEKSYGKGNAAPKSTFSGAILAGNVYDKTSNEPVFDSFFVKEFDNGLRVAIVGLTHPNIINWDAGNMTAANYTTRYADVVTAETIEYLTGDFVSVDGNDPVDLIICAEHMGKEVEYVGDGARAVLEYDDNADYIDLFIGAHDHLNADDMINGVKFVGIGSNGGRLGQVTITATEQADGSWAVNNKASDVVMTNHTIGSSGATLVAPDADYMDFPAMYAADAFAKGYANTAIGKLEGGPLVPVPDLKGTYQAYMQDTALIHRINEAMLNCANEYVTRGGAIDSTNTPVEKGGKKVFLSGTAPLDTFANAQPGDLTRGNVSTIYKYDNNTLCILEMTGAQFKQWMEWSYLFIGPYNNAGAAYGSEFFNLGPVMAAGDLSVPYGNGNMPGYNMDQFEGVKYTVDLTKPYGSRITITEFANGDAWSASSETDTFWVAVNNYRTDSQLTINASESSRPAVFPGASSPTLAYTPISATAKCIARDIDSVLTVGGVNPRNNGEGMLGVMVDFIERVNGGVINNTFASNWSYVTPAIDAGKKAAAVTLANIEYDNGNTNFLRPAQVGASSGYNYAKRALTDNEFAGKLVILHVNDAHGRDVKGSASVGTASVAQLKKDFAALGAEVLLVSAGDAIQGTPLVNLDDGASAIEFMEAAGYDLMVPGNHEFDFGGDNLLNILDGLATFDVLSANIIDKTTGDPLFDTNIVLTYGSVKVGVFGLTTPETFTKTHPDKIAGLDFLMNAALYKEAQDQVDELKGKGCDLIVCIGHLGVDTASAPNRSTDVIANVNGIDLWIDGHSHTQINKPGQLVKQKNGTDETLLVSAKQYLEFVGVVVYDLASKSIEDAYLIGPAAYSRTDSAVASLVNTRNAAVIAQLNVPIGATEVTLYGKNTTNPPGVRMSETNLGDFATDALKWVASKELGFQVDGAITNGGGIRDSIPTDGRAVSAQNPYDITMMDMVTVFPFGNTVTVIAITGAQLLEALEAATYCTPAVVGAFPQISGITFTLHTYTPYANGPLYAGSTYYAPANPGARVKDVKVGGQPLNLTKTYYIATNDFTAAGGDTYAIFKECSAFTNLGVPMEDALIDYLDELGGIILATSIYAAPQDRIIMQSEPGDDGGKVIGGGGGGGALTYTVTFDSNGGPAVPSQAIDPDGTVTKPADPVKEGYTFTGWYSDSECTQLYDFSGKVTKAFTLYAGWEEVEAPKIQYFSDVLTSDWFYGDVEYVYKRSLMLGTAENTFSPKINLTRGMIVTILYRLENLPGVDGLENPFSDVAASQYYTNAVIWAADNEVVTGYNGLFRPNDNVTRQELAAILYRYAGFAVIELPVLREYPGFDDDSIIADYAKDAVQALYEAEVINGRPGNVFDPKGNATRAEAAAMLHRFLTNAE